MLLEPPPDVFSDLTLFERSRPGCATPSVFGLEMEIAHRALVRSSDVELLNPRGRLQRPWASL